MNLLAMIMKFVAQGGKPVEPPRVYPVLKSAETYRVVNRPTHRSKYQPHQGTQERTRRLRQMAPALREAA